LGPFGSKYTERGEDFCRLRSKRDGSRAALRLGLIEMPVVHRFANPEQTSIQIAASPAECKQLSNAQPGSHE
jgi:hypothetical protein